MVQLLDNLLILTIIFKVIGTTKGFVKEEGKPSEWVVYEKTNSIDYKRIGTIEPKEDKLREFLEIKYGKPIKIW